MSDVLLELNDCGIRCVNDSVSVVSPGYALLEQDRIVTGDTARGKVFVAPQSSFSHFWQQLNLSPLALKSRLARHNADLAFAHLQDVLESAGRPREITLAVPGSFSREQLGIVLGLANAAKVRITGLVDSAVLAGCRLPEGDYWHLDIQLHQLVATHITVAEQIRRGEVFMQSALGLRTLHDLWAHVIADQFITQYRYDPLHHAQGEQQLHDRLPDWLEKLTDTREISVALSSAQGDYQVTLNRSALLTVSSDRFSQLKLQLDKLPQSRVVLSHRITSLPGMREFFESSSTLEENAVVMGFEANTARLISEPGAVRLVTELPVKIGEQSDISSDSEKTARAIAPEVTHLLYQGVALPLSESLSLDSASGKLQHHPGSTSNILRREGELWYLTAASSEAPLECGAQVEIEGEVLTLIRVED